MANKNIWVVFELSDGKPNRVSLELMQKAASMKEKASAVIIGENAKEAAPAAFANGADEVIAVSQKATFEGAAYILSQLIKKYEPLAVLIGSTNYGRDLSAALSARSRIGIASDCTDMWINAEGDEVSINWIRPSYDGKLNTNIAVAGTPQIGTFHAGTLPYKENFGGPSDGSIIEETVEIPDGVILTEGAKKQAKQLTELGFAGYPICMAKTQYSFSDDPTKLGAPKGFTVTVRNLKVSAGAGFIVALTGEIMTMPGLPKVPAAEKIDVDENGVISGLF